MKIWSKEKVEKKETETQTEDAERRGDVMERGSQTEEKYEPRGPETTTQNPPGRMKIPTKKFVKEVLPIRIIGDSMVKRMATQVKCEMEGSGCLSMSGANIGEIKQRVVEEAPKMRDGLLVIQGGGNGLGKIGEEETVSSVVEAVKAVEGKGMSVAVVGVLRRPREGQQYELLRTATNKRLHKKITDIKVEWLREKKGNISFLDLDVTLKEDRFFAADGVHLNDAGNTRMGGRLREWIRARSLRPVDKM